MVTRCQWDKQWSPHPALPPCLVTHCVETFAIPSESRLEAVTDQWTEVSRPNSSSSFTAAVQVNSYKQYRCEGGRPDGSYTRFWERDRSKYSTLS